MAKLSWMSHLYVALFTNGVLKVGRSVDPQKRLRQHADRLSCAGISLQRSQTAPVGDNVLLAESALIARCVAACEARHSSEWFSGLDFDIVTTWMRDAASAIYEQRPTEVRPIREETELSPEVVEWLRSRRYQFDPSCEPRWIDTRPTEPHWPDSAVMRWDVRQTDWWQIWPELRDHPCALLFAPRHPDRDGPPVFADWVRSFPRGYKWEDDLPSDLHSHIRTVLASSERLCDA